MLVGEVCRQPRRAGELAREHHQIEDQTDVAPRCARPARQCRIVHDAVARSEAAGRIGVPAQYVADADDAIECRLRFDERRRFERSPSGTWAT